MEHSKKKMMQNLQNLRKFIPYFLCWLVHKLPSQLKVINTTLLP